MASPFSPRPKAFPLAPTAHLRHPVPPALGSADDTLAAHPQRRRAEHVRPRSCPHPGTQIPAGSQESTVLCQGRIAFRDEATDLIRGLESPILTFQNRRHAHQRRNSNHIKENHAHTGKPKALLGSRLPAFQLRICVATPNLVLPRLIQKTDNRVLALWKTLGEIIKNEP